MRVWKYPPEVHQFVKARVDKMPDDVLAEACNKELGTSFTKSSMHAFRANHGYTPGIKKWTEEEYWKYQKHYPEGMYEYIVEHAAGVTSREMAERVNEIFGTSFTRNGMKSFRYKHGIQPSGVTGCFQKGSAPWNKGMKQTEWCSAEGIEKSKRTRFQKGHKNKNEQPIGTIKKNADGYYYIKISNERKRKDRWQALHRYVWEKHNGAIPEGMIIVFKDKDKSNMDIDNLMMVSREEHVRMCQNNYYFTDPQVTETALGIIKLKEAARRRNKGE